MHSNWPVAYQLDGIDEWNEWVVITVECKALRFHQVSRHSQVHTTARHSFSIWPYLSFVLDNVREHNGIGPSLSLCPGRIHPSRPYNKLSALMMVCLVD